MRVGGRWPRRRRGRPRTPAPRPRGCPGGGRRAAPVAAGDRRRRAVTGLERRYRLLLRVLPGWYRAVWEQDMVATFLTGVEAAVAGDEQADLVGEYGWPDRAEVASVLALAVRLRLGGAPAYAQSRAWGAAARRVALVVLLINAVWSVLDVGMTVWLSGAIPVLPSPPPDTVGASSLGEWVL